MTGSHIVLIFIYTNKCFFFRKKLEDLVERVGHCGVEDCLDELFTEEEMTSIKEFWQKGRQCFPSKIMRILGESKQ